MNTFQAIQQNVESKESLSEHAKSEFKEQVGQMKRLVFHFLEGFLWEPFESPKKSVHRLLGQLVNRDSNLFELLWDRIDQLSHEQFTRNGFHRQSRLSQSKFPSVNFRTCRVQSAFFSVL